MVVLRTSLLHNGRMYLFVSCWALAVFVSANLELPRGVVGTLHVFRVGVLGEVSVLEVFSPALCLTFFSK